MGDTIFLIVGESGSGKTTIVSSLEKKYELTSIPSYTVRPKRSENEYGHIFVSQKEFDKLQLVGYSKYNGYDYGATPEQVESYDLYVIDVKGIEYFKNAYRGKKQVKIIYIKSSISTRIERMEQRGDKFSLIMERIITDCFDFKNVPSYADYIVENNKDANLKNVIFQVWDYIREQIKEE